MINVIHAVEYALALVFSLMEQPLPLTSSNHVSGWRDPVHQSQCDTLHPLSTLPTPSDSFSLILPPFTSHPLFFHSLPLPSPSSPLKV